jgi:dihydrofolate synthase/folylpolyglutamate synthase
VAHWYLARLDVPRGASAEALAEVARELGGSLACFDDVASAFAASLEAADEGDRILAFGSFHTVAAAMRALKARRR